MKKVLLGTSAIALAGAFAAPADAAEWTVRVGGYMEQYAAYSSSDVDNVPTFGTSTTANLVTGAVTTSPTYTGRFSGGDFDGVDSKQDAEIWFLPSITLDNGMEIGANIQLEGNTSSDTIDESYMFIRGSFGELNVGSENSAGYKMMYAAPDVTFVGVNSGSLMNWVPFSGTGVAGDIFRGTMGTSFVETLRNNDSNRFTYYTPRFAGFQVGVSYARDGTQDSVAQVDCDVTTCDFFDVGANYVNSFGDFNVALAGRYGIASVPGAGDPEVWAAGLNLGYAGFTIGGSYAHSDADHGVQEGQFWDVGASYETGPWGFSFTFSRGENVDNDCFRGVAGLSCGSNLREEADQYLVGINYAMAQGVDLNVFGAYVDFEGADMFDSGGSFNTQVDGWVFGTGLRIRF